MTESTKSSDDSILEFIKDVLGYKASNVFDTPIAMAIDTALSTIHNLGVGDEPFNSVVEHPTMKWESVSSDNALSLIKSAVYCSVRLEFDPPVNSFGQENLRKQLDEHHWRIKAISEERKKS